MKQIYMILSIPSLLLGLCVVYWTPSASSWRTCLITFKQAELKLIGRANLQQLFTSQSSSSTSSSSFFKSNSTKLFTAINEAISKSTGEVFKGTSDGDSYIGGGGVSVGSIKDITSGKEYFYKSSGLRDFNMLQAKFISAQEIYNTNTIKVPQPICYGISKSKSFVVFEKLKFGNLEDGSFMEFGGKIADMHRHTSQNGMFGFHINNSIGETFQPNDWTPNWADFYDKFRLGHMLSICRKDGLVFNNEVQLREKVHSILSQHKCVPSLVHGDLWCGNSAFTVKGEPVIFNPATYYGDREVDIAMSRLFYFPDGFYDEYKWWFCRQVGSDIREEIYNLYHVLNHRDYFVISEAQRMIDKIMLYKLK